MADLGSSALGIVDQPGARRGTVALTGVGPVADGARVHPASAEIAALAWYARRLSSEQLSEVMEAIQSVRHV
ncbi:MAG TPA: hypothetical protein VFT95_06230 [Micromonosporaceae bacterium]|nr:hypothetical protein [Micromonosporaceae bacterium]